MLIREIDWRYSSTKQMFQVAAATLDHIRHEIASEDVDEALEQSESALGVAFVVAQTYIYGTVGDAMLRSPASKNVLERLRSKSDHSKKRTNFSTAN